MNNWDQVPVVQRVCSTIHWIKHFTLDTVTQYILLVLNQWIFIYCIQHFNNWGLANSLILQLSWKSSFIEVIIHSQQEGLSTSYCKIISPTTQRLKMAQKITADIVKIAGCLPCATSLLKKSSALQRQHLLVSYFKILGLAWNETITFPDMSRNAHN